MEVTLTEDQEFFRDTTVRYLGAECDMTRVRALARSDDGFDRDGWRQGAELGWTSLLVPEDHGGGSVSGQGVVDLTLVADAFGRHVAPGPLGPTNVVAAAIANERAGAHAELLAGLLAGEQIATWCGAEHALGLDAVVATPTDAGHVLSGSSSPVEAAGQASSLLVTARTGDGLAQFVVPATSDGIEITSLVALDPVRRFARVDFTEVEVPRSAALAPAATVDAEVERQLLHALVVQSATMVGAAERTFEFTVEWAFDRYSFGRPLASYQELKHRFADMKMWLEASHALATTSAREVQVGDPGAVETASATKAYVADRLTELMHDCVQMHGGIGLTTDHDLHLYLRRVVTERSLFGPPAVHRRRLADLAVAAA